MKLVFALVALAAACGSTPDDRAGDEAPSGIGASDPGDGTSDGAKPEGDADPWSRGPSLGARRLANGDVEIRVRAPNATRIDVSFFDDATTNDEKARETLALEGDRFRGVVPAAKVGDAVFYALRSFGPNGDAEVDANGNRMKPDKLILDPHGLEVSHDPGAAGTPKSVLVTLPEHVAERPKRELQDDVIYEVHLRGLTMNDPSVPEAERGTYAGAARKAKYLRELGVTAIEFLPLHETPNDQNDKTADSGGDNYWGYSTLSFFAPDRRYAKDRAPGGPTRELRAMVEAFHAEGLKVFADVVYNHTAGGAGFRLLDNATFYEVGDDATKYVNSNGVGPNFNTANPVAGDLVVASLKYWRDVLGFDGFRFDLASILGNECARGCYRFGKKGLVQRIADELPDVALIAEPWGLAPGSYQVGGFPKGWSEWNDRYRDAVRRDLNRLGVDAVTPREIARRLSGSPDLYEGGGRSPSASINFIVAHDGMTLADLFAYDAKHNDQAWPFGPSNGGTDNDLAFSHGGDPKRQRSVARTALLFLALSAGVPMITGGDERLRTLRGNNNPYNLDSSANWLDWTPNVDRDAFAVFAKNAFAFRAAHPELRPSQHWKADDVRFVRDDGMTADAGYLDDGNRQFLGMVIGDVYVAYSGWSGTMNVVLPSPPAGKKWMLAGDTSEGAEAWGNWYATPVASAASHSLGRRSIAVFVAK